MTPTLGTSVLDVRCVECGAERENYCMENGYVTSFHQSRINKAASVTREANAAARARAERIGR